MYREDEQSNFDDVGDFHEKFELINVTHGGVGQRHMPADLLDFRLKFMQEELDEFSDAMDAENEAKAFDALLDLVYVAMGTAHLLGFPWQEGWDLVQVANMSKLRATTGMVGPRGDAKYDVIKGPDFVPPDIEGLLQKHGWPKQSTEPAG